MAPPYTGLNSLGGCHRVSTNDLSELKGAFGEFRAAIVGRLDRFETKLDSVASSVNGINERLTEHEGRIDRLEQQVAQRTAWWRSALSPIVYIGVFIAGALGFHVIKP